MVCQVRPELFTEPATIAVAADTETINLQTELGTGGEFIIVSDIGYRPTDSVAATTPLTPVYLHNKSISHFAGGHFAAQLKGSTLNIYPVQKLGFDMVVNWRYAEPPDVTINDDHFLFGEVSQVHDYVPLAAARLLMIARSMPIEGVSLLIREVIGDDLGNNVFDRLHKAVMQNRANPNLSRKRDA